MPKEEPDSQILVGVVGVCASGKSTLIKSLEAHGYKTRHIAQEHSYVKDMWLRLTNPDVLVFLDVDYPTTLKRRKFDWTEKDYAEQQRRLMHARQHANLYLDTTSLTADEVLQQVINFLSRNT
jgi:adenylate kinase